MIVIEYHLSQKNIDTKRSALALFPVIAIAAAMAKAPNMKYLIFKSKRECYDIRIIDKEIEFKKEIVINDIKQARKLSKINDLLYVDTNGKLCCTETLDSAINLVKYNDKNVTLLSDITYTFNGNTYKSKSELEDEINRLETDKEVEITYSATYNKITKKITRKIKIIEG